MLWTPRNAGRIAPVRPPSLIGPMGVSGASQLPRNLTINGVTVQALFAYVASDITGSPGSYSWPEHYGAAGGTLSEAGAGALAAAQAGPFTDATTGAKGDGTNYAVTAAAAFGDVGTGDVVLELVASGLTAASVNLLAKRGAGAGADNGYQLRLNPSSQLNFYIISNGATPAPQAAALGAGVYHCIVFCDRSGSGQWYVNGSASGSAEDISGAQVSLANDDVLEIFGADAAQPFAGTIYSLALWTQAAWLDTHLQAAVAQERCHRAFGMVASLTRRSVSYPTVTRASTRHFQVGSAFHGVAAGGHCIEEDSAGKRYVSVYGQRTNVCTHPLSFADGAMWTVRGALTVDSNVASPLAPDGTETASKISAIGASGAGGDNEYFAIEGAFTGAAYAASLFVRRDSTSGTLIAESTYGPTKGQWSVDLSALPDAWVRLHAKSAYVTQNYAFIPSSNNGGMYLYASAGAPLSIYAWCAQLENDPGCAGPPIPVGSATKAAEIVSWPVADFGIPGSVELHLRSYDTVPTDRRLWSWYDADGDGAIELYLDVDGHVHLRVHDGTSENADIEVTTAANDGTWRRVIASWENNYVRLRVGDTDAIDTSCALPTLASLDTSRVGASESGQYLDGDIAEFRAHKRRII